MAKQLHIFLENRPGRLESVTQELCKNKINIIAFTIQDRGDFGLMKLAVNKPEQAYLALADKGYACALKEVVFISVPDRPGNLARLASLLLKNKVNI
ncbi:MAG: acetolactate synthase, partial [Candidatus Omnitrophica bacterium]|nr:acetolactate synthase [Candidatus Omnitrophota bacterium]